VWASDFNFDLPDERIAQHPDERRDRLRLMVVDDRRGCWKRRSFADFPELMDPRDVVGGLGLSGAHIDKCKCGVGFVETRLVGAKPTTRAVAIGGPHDAEHHSTPPTTECDCAALGPRMRQVAGGSPKNLCATISGTTAAGAFGPRCVTTAKS
jgi:hypothetical protein